MKQTGSHKLDIAAIAYAVLLSVACLARGGIYDVVMVYLLFASMPILFFALKSGLVVHPLLKTIGISFLGFFLLVLFLQHQVLPPVSVEAYLQTTKGIENTAHPAALQDKAAWFQEIGHAIFLVIMFVIALFIGASESSTRLFFQGLLVSGALFLAITFFVVTANGVPSSSFYSYTHGFVNPNNAATYLGIMLLLAIMQATRFLRRPSRAAHKVFLEFIDRLNIASMMKGFFVLFSVLLFLAGLFMTGSRAGIALSLLSGFLFCLIMVLKANLESRTWKWVIAGALVVIVGILAWSFFNFGDIFMRKMERNGASHNTRLEIFSGTLSMIGDHPWLGVGLGSFPGAYQKYRPENVSSDGIIDKAHNSYLEFAAEMGLPAFLVLMAVIITVGLLLYRYVRERSERYVTPSLGLSVWTLAATHSLVDFPLQIPGIAALVIAIVTISVSQTHPDFSRPADGSGDVPTRRMRVRKRGKSKPLVSPET